MKEYILITGASSGIGYEMAYQLAEKAYNLILVARTESRLQQMQSDLTKKYGVLVRYFIADLSGVNAAKGLYERVKAENLSVSHLVNNAGTGKYGHFTETSLDEELDMIQPRDPDQAFFAGYGKPEIRPDYEYRIRALIFTVPLFCRVFRNQSICDGIQRNPCGGTGRNRRYR